MTSVLGELTPGRITRSSTRRRALVAAAAALVVGLASSSVSAATYQVGPGRQYTQISQVATILNPGDIVEVDGNATYGPVTFNRAGTASQRITIRGIRVAGNRPVIAGSDQYGYTIYTRSNNGQMGFLTLEGFEITGGSAACIRNQARDVIFRDIKVHGCARHGLLSHDFYSGNLTVENSEFTNIGGTYSGENVKHPIYITTSQDTLPGSVCRLQFNYVHHNRSGNNIKSRCERNEIYYNWLEGAEYYELEMIGPEESSTGRRCDSDVVGNFIFGYGDYVIRMGSDGHTPSNGRYRFVNNTIVSMDPGFGGIIRHGGPIESVEMFNNIVFAHPSTSGSPRLWRVDGSWLHGEMITGANNWMSSNLAANQTSSAGAAILASSLRGTDPGFVNSSSITAFDPRITGTAAVIDRGTASVTGSNAYPIPNPLTTIDRHPGYRTAAGTARPPAGALDLGAFENGAGGGSTPPPAAPTNLRIIR